MNAANEIGGEYMSRLARRIIWGLWAVALLFAVVLAALNLLFGNLNQDEGWYLYAARMVNDGWRPYRDFAFTQAPVQPFVYAALYGWVDRFGLAGGRGLTALFGIGAALASAWLAGRLVPRSMMRVTALIAFALAGLNVYQSYFTTMVKTYALCALFCMTGLGLLTYAHGRRGGWAAFGAGVLLALAAGTRISAGAFLPVVGLYLGWCVWRRYARPPVFWGFVIGGCATLAMVFGPFLLGSPEGFFFGVVEYHTLRSSPNLRSALLFKLGFLSRMAQAYFLCLALGAMAVAAHMVCRKVAMRAQVPGDARMECPYAALLVAIGTGIILSTMVHISAPFPYEDYQVWLYPALAALVAVLVVRPFAWLAGYMRERAALTLTVTVVLLSLLSSFSSPVNQDWFVTGRNGIWWRVREESEIAQLRRAAQWIRAHSAEDSLILSQDAYLAVEAGRRLPRGMEMGTFSYYPDFDRVRAERLRVMNRDMLRETLCENIAEVAAVSGYTFAQAMPEVIEVPDAEREEFMRLIDKVFAPDMEIPGFGQAHTGLTLYRRRP